MSDKLMMRSLLRNVGFIARSLLPEPTQNVLAKMNKLLLSSVEEMVDSGALEELSAFLSSMDVDDTDEDLNALFYFLAQSLLISFTYRKANIDRLDRSSFAQQGAELECEMREVKPVEIVLEKAVIADQRLKSEPREESEFAASTSNDVMHIEDFPVHEALSPKSEPYDDFDYPMSEVEDDDEAEDSTKDRTRVKCPFCPKKFPATNHTGIRKHIFSLHEFTGSLFKCLKCNIGVNSETHLKVCSGPLVFDYDPEKESFRKRRSCIITGHKCPLCNEPLKTSLKNGVALTVLATHLRIKHVDTPGTFFRCSVCTELRTRSPSNFHRHNKAFSMKTMKYERALACGGELEYFYCSAKP